MNDWSMLNDISKRSRHPDNKIELNKHQKCVVASGSVVGVSHQIYIISNSIFYEKRFSWASSLCINASCIFHTTIEPRNMANEETINRFHANERDGCQQEMWIIIIKKRKTIETKNLNKRAARCNQPIVSVTCMCVCVVRTFVWNTHKLVARCDYVALSVVLWFLVVYAFLLSFLNPHDIYISWTVCWTVQLMHPTCERISYSKALHMVAGT